VQVHCVDAVAKKAAFIRQLRAELGLGNLHAHHARLTPEGERGQPAIVVPPVTLAVSRAFGSLADFIRLSQPLMADTGVWVAMKGAVPDDELLELPEGVNCSAAITLAVPQMDARRHLLLLERRGAPAAA
jgi:16S rRNA (guanine527-N7)-methyltransferase